MKNVLMLFLSILIVLPGPWAQGDVVLTPLDINSHLEKALDRIQSERAQEQKRTGGALLVAGGALVGAGLASTVIGTPYTIGAAPGIFLATGGVLSLGGLILLFRGAPEDKRTQSYKDLPQWKLEDIAEKVAIGQDILNQHSIVAEREKWWSGILTVVAGATNLTLGTMVSSGNPREMMQSTGYFFGILGYADMLYEGRLWAGGSMAALGVSNLATYHTDINSPSSDYLYISGGIVAASGIFRILTAQSAEVEEANFRDFIKVGTVSFNRPELFIVPAVAGGMVAGLRATF